MCIKSHAEKSRASLGKFFKIVLKIKQMIILYIYLYMDDNWLQSFDMTLRQDKPYLIAVLTHELLEIGGDVEHECGGSVVWLSQCHAEAECLHLDARAGREPRQQAALVGRHVGARLVVVA